MPLHFRRFIVALVLLAGVLCIAPGARAEEASRSSKPTKNLIEGGLILARPAALQTGMMTGIDALLTRGTTLGWGIRASWSTATEYTSSWTVRNDDIRLRIFGVLQHSSGRGTFGLRLGFGGTLVHEIRTLSQGSRASITGEDFRNTAWSLLPAADLEFVVVLRILGGWGIMVNGGPSLHLVQGAGNLGWTGGLGVSWQY